MRKCGHAKVEDKGTIIVVGEEGQVSEDVEVHSRKEIRLSSCFERAFVFAFSLSREIPRGGVELSE